MSNNLLKPSFFPSEAGDTTLPAQSGKSSKIPISDVIGNERYQLVPSRVLQIPVVPNEAGGTTDPRSIAHRAACSSPVSNDISNVGSQTVLSKGCKKPAVPSEFGSTNISAISNYISNGGSSRKAAAKTRIVYSSGQPGNPQDLHSNSQMAIPMMNPIARRFQKKNHSKGKKLW